MNKHKYLNKIIIVMLVFLASLFIASPKSKAAGLTKEQQEKVANFAVGFITKGNEKGILAYNNSDMEKRNTGWKNTTYSDGIMYFDCSAFVAFVYNQTCNAGASTGSPDDVASSYCFSEVYSGSLYEMKRNTEQMQVGDLLLVSGKHIAIYVGNGKVTHFASEKSGALVAPLRDGFFNGSEGSSENKDQTTLNSEEKNVQAKILRFNENASYVKGFEQYVWPTGEDNLTWTDTTLDSNDFSYAGVTDGTFGVKVYDFEWILNCLKDILDWFIGIVTYLSRVVIVGWTELIEKIPVLIMEWTAEEESSLTIEKILFNKVPLLDVNFFNLKSSGGQEIETDSVMYIIKSNIAMWYYMVRTISIVGLLITLIYIGIRIAISSVAEEKAKYKSLLTSWFVSFIIVFGIHYFMIAVLTVNDSMLTLIGNMNVSEETIYDTVRSQAYAIPASVGWKAAIMYIILVILLFRFLIKYIKRFLVIAILTLLAPIIGIGYSIDKIKDNKSQTLANWAKEYMFNVIIQFVHALLYTVFITMAFNMMGKGIIATLMAFLLIQFMFKAEELFKEIFGIKSSQMKNLGQKEINAIVGAKTVITAAKINGKMLGTVTKPVRAAGKAIIEKSDQNKIKKLSNTMKANATIRKLEGIEPISKLAEDAKDINYNGNNNDDNIDLGNQKEEKNTEGKINFAGKEYDISAAEKTFEDEVDYNQLASNIYEQAGGTGIGKVSRKAGQIKKSVKTMKSSVKPAVEQYKNQRRKVKNSVNSKQTLGRGIGEKAAFVATFGLSGAILNQRRLMADYKNQIREQKASNTGLIPKFEMPVSNFSDGDNLNVDSRETIIITLKQNVNKEYQKLQKDETVDDEVLDNVVERAFTVIPKSNIRDQVITEIEDKRQPNENGQHIEDKKGIFTKTDINKMIDKMKLPRRTSKAKLKDNIDEVLKEKIENATGKSKEQITKEDMEKELKELNAEGVVSLIQAATLRNDNNILEKGLNKNKYAKLLAQIDELKKQQFYQSEKIDRTTTRKRKEKKDAEQVIHNILNDGKGNS